MNLTFLAAIEPVATGKFLVDWNQLLNIVYALGMAIIGYLTLRIHSKTNKVADKVTKIDEKADATAVTLKEVKLDVNSGRSKLEEKLTKVEEKLLVATSEKATSAEQVRSEQDKAVALAAAKTAAPAAAHDTGRSSGGSARMGKAITEITEAAQETKDLAEETTKLSEETTESAEKTEELARKHKTS